MKTKQQIEYERRVMKDVHLTKLKRKYDLLKSSKTIKLQEYYDRKLERAFRRWEKSYDIKTKNIIIKNENKLKEETMKKQGATKEQIEAKKKKLRKTKDKGWQWWFDKCKRIKQKKIKILEGKKCYTCESNNAVHGGHGIKAQRHSTALIDKNIHPQCYRCNILLEGNQGEYFKKLEKDYGVEYLDWLRKEAKTGERPTIEWMKQEILRDQEIIKKLTS